MKRAADDESMARLLATQLQQQQRRVQEEANAAAPVSLSVLEEQKQVLVVDRGSIDALTAVQETEEEKQNILRQFEVACARLNEIKSIRKPLAEREDELRQLKERRQEELLNIRVRLMDSHSPVSHFYNSASSRSE